MSGIAHYFVINYRAGQLLVAVDNVIKFREFMNQFSLPSWIMRSIRFLFCVCLLGYHQLAEAQPERPPNVVIVLADDLGYADLQGYGGKIPTPNLNRLQEEGMKFTSFYAQPQCSPSRAALLTGAYPQRVGIPWVVGPEGPSWTKERYFVGLNPDEETLAELLLAKGYETACIGKWHLGHHTPHLPLKHGFKEFMGIPYSNDMSPASSTEWPDLPFIAGEKPTEVNPDQRYLTRRLTEKAVEFIGQNRKRPFFLYLAHPMPHVPLFVSPQFQNKSAKGLYADVIQEVDWSVGEITRILKKLRLEENTIVIFTSDNGPWLVYGDHAGSAGQFREGKATTFEGGVRVPFIVRWKGVVPAGSSTDKVAGLIDVLPTIVALTDASTPVNSIDGENLAPLLKGDTNHMGREVHYFFHIDELQAVRRGKWKLHLQHAFEHVAEPGKEGAKGTATYQVIPLSLFNLENDPGEKYNLADQHPDIVLDLKKTAEEFQGRMKTEKRHCGTSHLPAN